MADITIGGVSTTIEIVLFLARKWVEHKAQSEGLSTEEALAQAKANYEAAQTENNELKEAGHGQSDR